MWLSRPLRHSVSQLPQQAFELWVLDSCGELLTSPKSSSPCWTSPILLPAEWRLVYSGAPRHTRSSHSSSGKAFSLFREYFCFSLVGGGGVVANRVAMMSWKWGKRSDGHNCTSSVHRTSIKALIAVLFSQSNSQLGLTTKNGFLSVKDLTCKS